MDINGINNNLYKNNLDNAKSKAADDDFEKQLQKAYDDKDEKALKKVCKDFESILMNMMYKEMKATVPKSDILPDDQGKEIFDSMLDDKLMDEASKGGGMGLADTLYKQLSKQMQAAYKPKNKD